MSDICPSADICPIFNGVLKDKKFTIKSYKDQYCEAGEIGRQKCLRWQCKQKYGKVPENLLPNANDSLENIGRINSWL